LHSEALKHVSPHRTPDGYAGNCSIFQNPVSVMPSLSANLLHGGRLVDPTPAELEVSDVLRKWQLGNGEPDI
jgi:hypothetical protein